MYTMYSHVYRDITIRSRVDHDAINVHVELLTVHIVLQRKRVCTTPTQKNKKTRKTQSLQCIRPCKVQLEPPASKDHHVT